MNIPVSVSVLKPGLLVSLRTSLFGGVQYSRTELEREHTTEDGKRRARWETFKQVSDPAEFDQGTKVRSEAGAMIRRECYASAFGLLCPEARRDSLEDAIAAARRQIADYNANASLSRIELYVMVGRIAADDAEAVRAISAELRQLVDKMTQGIRAADPEAIREAANEARTLGGMLTADSRQKVEAAIKEARTIARQLVKAGESAAEVVGELQLTALDAARFAFLDTDAPATVETEAPAGRGIDLLPADPVAGSTWNPQPAPAQLEL